jgi:hypothetical protein
MSAGSEVGLCHVEHGYREEPGSTLFFFFAGLLVLDGFAHVAATEDADATLALTHLPIQALPGPVSGNVGSFGALGKDQEQVSEAVAVECLRECEELGPCLGVAERFDLLGDRFVQLLGLGSSFLGALAGGNFAGHGSLLSTTPHVFLP